jgi:Replication initiator protein, pSAM2
VLRFGVQLDAKGLIAPSENADRAVRYLTKYLSKNISDTYTDNSDPAYQVHIDRLRDEVRWLPCTPGCANWLRYGIQPDNPGPGLIPGRCTSKAHDRENLGLGGRRVLVSRQWSGKTLTEHKADRATVVREGLTSAGIDAPELDRMAASVTLPDGHHGSCGPTPDPTPTSTPESSSPQSWNVSSGAPSTRPPRPARCLWTAFRQLESHPDLRAAGRRDHSSASSDPGPHLVEGAAVNGERSESAGHERSECR